ncbi:hypothetical protein [Maribacter arenosus]|uniref:DUF4468 domain-containing protein n=1 Tax=Maribacter arenosus TaxID=1854708 RepID=A0ABR7VIM5_9FLAO|nr:hypothetical protein [Maribacter arenosus]MBD0851909.1 hypothetical protein [Maribacter arenosus]
MKNTFFILFLLYFLTGCSDQKLTHQETVTKYYNARDAANYNELKTLINDSITIIAGDYVMPYSHDSFYEQFKWDSIFRPSYKIVELEEKNNQIIASVALNSVRNEFLKNNAMTCQYKISFNYGKISKIEELECKSADWNIWQKERDSLVSWIKKNHPELDGFINDMTMNGAMNYLKAIELYETDKNAL